MPLRTPPHIGQADNITTPTDRRYVALEYIAQGPKLGQIIARKTAIPDTIALDFPCYQGQNRSVYSGQKLNVCRVALAHTRQITITVKQKKGTILQKWSVYFAPISTGDNAF